MMSNQSSKAALVSPPKTRGATNRLPTILMFGLLAIILGGALFVAGRLFGEGVQPHKSQDSEYYEMDDGTQAGDGIRLLPDERLPDSPPTTAGMVHHRVDNRLFINPFPPSGEVILDELRNGPTLEVVVTNATLVYKDVTDLSTSETGGTIQQVLVLGSVDDISGHGSVVVWGEKRGERVIAEVLQYFPR